MTQDYDNYSLKKLEEWVHDVLNCDISSDDIYETIKNVVKENIEYHEKSLSKSKNLFSKLNGEILDEFVVFDNTNWKSHWDNYVSPFPDDQITYNFENLCANEKTEEDKSKCMEYNVRETEYLKENRIKKWVLPVEQEGENDYYVRFPDDLLEVTNLKEGDQVEWVDNKDGTYLIKKVERRTEV